MHKSASIHAAIGLMLLGHGADAALESKLSRRKVAVAALTGVVPSAANARLDSPVATKRAQQQILNEHAARRFSRPGTPVAISTTYYDGRRMRQLVATRDLLASTRVAVYPVELVSATGTFDTTYAMTIYKTPEFEVITGTAGIPTRKSLSEAYVGGLPTIAMFTNEPDWDGRPNSNLIFPTTDDIGVRIGDVLCGYLETSVDVPAGAVLTTCYYEAAVPRSYPTWCELTPAKQVRGRAPQTVSSS
jgi:hypothetical protein